MKIGDIVYYLSCEFIVAGMNDQKKTITLRNRASKLKQEDITVEARFAKKYNQQHIKSHRTR